MTEVALALFCKGWAPVLISSFLDSSLEAIAVDSVYFFVSFESFWVEEGAASAAFETCYVVSDVLLLFLSYFMTDTYITNDRSCLYKSNF